MSAAIRHQPRLVGHGPLSDSSRRPRSAVCLVPSAAVHRQPLGRGAPSASSHQLQMAVSLVLLVAVCRDSMGAVMRPCSPQLQGAQGGTFYQAGNGFFALVFLALWLHGKVVRIVNEKNRVVEIEWDTDCVAKETKLGHVKSCHRQNGIQIRR